METPVLILPGIYDSGPTHWQTLWENKFPHYQRVVQREWFYPDLNEWVDTLNQAIQTIQQPVALVAHSLACVQVAHWAQRYQGNIAGALLVAPCDVESDSHCPPEARGFGPIPTAPLPFKSMIVASTNDPYILFERARHLSECWKTQLINLGNQGHINADSGLGEWIEGQNLLKRLLEYR